MDASLRARLVEVVGDAALVDGEDRVRPASVAEVAGVCRVCAETGTPLSVSSSQDGTAPSGGVAVILEPLDSIALRGDSLTLTAGAGARLDAVAAAVSSAGLTMAAALPGKGPLHVGSAVARGTLPRRALCGIEAVLPTGETVRAGGEVLKDVAGYDLVSLLLGSQGRLGLITSVTFRLLPAAVPQPSDGEVATRSEPTDSIRAAFDPAGLLRS